jgi:hypothetical protein
LDGLATIVKRSTGKINIKVSDKTALAVDFKGSTFLLNIKDPISALLNKRVTSLDYLKNLKPQKKWVHYLIIKGRAFLFCEKEKKLSVLVGKQFLKLAVY